MPIYEYRCSDCGHRLEALQRLADSPMLVCPSCGKESLVKLISAVGFQLKGSGWYATDFKNSGAKPVDKPKAESGSDGATSGAKGEGTATSSEKSDAKPAAQAAGGESKPATSESSAPAAAPAKPTAKPAATGS